MIPTRIEITNTKSTSRLLPWSYVAKTPGVYRANAAGAHDGDFVLVGQDLVSYYLNTKGEPPYILKISDTGSGWYETHKYRILQKRLVVTVPEGTLVFS